MGRHLNHEKQCPIHRPEAEREPSKGCLRAKEGPCSAEDGGDGLGEPDWGASGGLQTIAREFGSYFKNDRKKTLVTKTHIT